MLSRFFARPGSPAVALAFAVLAGATLLTLGSGCSKKETAEVQIRKVLDEGVAALEARDSKRAAETLSKDYLDARGRTRDKLKGLAFFALQQGPVLVALQDVAITVNGDNAEARVKAMAVQGSGQLKTAADLLPTNARTFDLSIKLAKEDGDWRVVALDGDGSPNVD